MLFQLHQDKGNSPPRTCSHRGARGGMVLLPPAGTSRHARVGEAWGEHPPCSLSSPGHRPLPKHLHPSLGQVPISLDGVQQGPTSAALVPGPATDNGHRQPLAINRSRFQLTGEKGRGTLSQAQAADAGPRAQRDPALLPARSQARPQPWWPRMLGDAGAVDMGTALGAASSTVVISLQLVRGSGVTRPRRGVLPEVYAEGWARCSCLHGAGTRVHFVPGVQWSQMGPPRGASAAFPGRIPLPQHEGGGPGAGNRRQPGAGTRCLGALHMPQPAQPAPAPCFSAHLQELCLDT